MKKLLIAVLFTLAAMGIASAATLALTGTIAKTADIVITPTAAASAIALTSSDYSSTKLKVADAAVTTNCKAWTITASSANTWELFLDGTTSAEDVPYVFYITADNTPATVYVTSPSDLTEAFTNNKGSTNLDLMITYSAVTYSGGSYTDTITVTVAAN